MTKPGPPRYSLSVVQEIVLPAGERSKKLQNFLTKRFPIGYVRKLFRKNGVRLNGKRPKADELVHPGDRIQLYIPFEKASKPNRHRAKARPELEIIFEDRDVVVINKPAGVAVHEGKYVLKRHSILGMLESRYRDQEIIPTLVHRIDKGTSGVLIAAKNVETAKQLEDLFENGNVEKEYLCLVAGRIQQDDGKIEFPLPGREGKPVRALTRFRVAKRFSETTLIHANIETGRMHQIRLHFAKFGYPVVMDDQHGDFSFNKRFRKEFGLKRQFLHASRLTLTYRGKNGTWTAPLPGDLQRTLRLLARSTKPSPATRT